MTNVLPCEQACLSSAVCGGSTSQMCSRAFLSPYAAENKPFQEGQGMLAAASSAAVLLPDCVAIAYKSQHTDTMPRYTRRTTELETLACSWKRLGIERMAGGTLASGMCSPRSDTLSSSLSTLQPCHTNAPLHSGKD